MTSGTNELLCVEPIPREKRECSTPWGYSREVGKTRTGKYGSLRSEQEFLHQELGEKQTMEEKQVRKQAELRSASTGAQVASSWALAPGPADGPAQVRKDTCTNG